MGAQAASPDASRRSRPRRRRAVQSVLPRRRCRQHRDRVRRRRDSAADRARATTARSATRTRARSALSSTRARPIRPAAFRPTKPTSGPRASALEFDVKASEADLPLLFQLPGVSSIDAISAHARVSLKKVRIFEGMLPLAVPEVRPRYVTATFVDESGVAVGAPLELTGPTASSGLANWTGTGSVPVQAGSKLGVRIGIGQNGGTCAAANRGGGLGYSCFDAQNYSTGLAAIAGFSGLRRRNAARADARLVRGLARDCLLRVSLLLRGGACGRRDDLWGRRPGRGANRVGHDRSRPGAEIRGPGQGARLQPDCRLHLQRRGLVDALCLPDPARQRQVRHLA